MGCQWPVIEDNHHHHPLMRATEVGPFRCLGCLEMGCGSRYVCVEEECGYVLHEHCALPDATITHPLFPGCNFHFYDAPVTDRRRCDACGGDGNGFVYYCPKKGLDLHPCCAKLELSEVVKDEEGSIALVLHDREISKCYICGKRKLNKGARSWTYVSECDEFHFHVRCMKEEAVEALEAAISGGRRGAASGKSQTQRVEGRPAILQLARRNAKRKGKAFALLKKIVRTAISLIMAVLVGDPTVFAVNLIVSLISSN